MARPIRAPITKPDTIESIITRCFDAYKTDDRATIEQIIAEDLTFTSPYDDGIDRAAYFERCWPMHREIDNVMIQRIFTEGDEAFVTYLLTLTDGRQFTNTEFMTVRDGKISSVHVYFGPTYKNGNFVAPPEA